MLLSVSTTTDSSAPGVVAMDGMASGKTATSWPLSGGASLGFSLGKKSWTGAKQEQNDSTRDLERKQFDPHDAQNHLAEIKKRREQEE